MAAPGIGIVDLVNACAFIYDMCMRYKDAPREFEEIAEKAKSTAVVLERIDIEAGISGNLVDRAGPQAYNQLQDNLKSLRSDIEKLEVLVRKYAKIHDKAPGRRLIFALKESSGLTDLRRRIGLHEQMLQIWYMTLVYGSLRRLEGGQEDILKAIKAIKNWSPMKKREVKRSLQNGDIKPLEQELSKSGLEPEAIDSSLGTVVDYVDAPPLEQVRMESRVRSRLSAMTGPEGASLLPTVSAITSARRPHNTYHIDGLPRRRSRDDLPGSLNIMRFSEERIANAERRDAEREDFEREDAERKQAVYLHRKEKIYPSHGEDLVIMPADSRRPRRSSDTTKPPPHSPFLVVSDTSPRYRPASYHGPSDQHEPRRPDADNRNSDEQVIFIQGPPRRRRSSIRRSDRSNKDRRDSSTHSYVRTRSSSGEETSGRRKHVNKMDRIDSIPL